METSLDKLPSDRYLTTTDSEHERLVSDMQTVFRVYLGNPLPDEDINKMMRIVQVGSKHLDEDTDPETYSSVMKARNTFFQLLIEGGKLNEDSLENLIKQKPTFVPLDTFIQSVSTMDNLGLDAVKVVNAFPSAIGFSAETVEAKMDNLASLGLDAVKVVNTLPSAIGYSTENIKTKINALIEIGLIKSGSDIPLETKTQIQQFFILPVESLLLYITGVEDPSRIDLERIASHARQFVARYATNTTERKERYLERLPEIYRELGRIAIDHAEYMKIPKEGLQLRGRYVGESAGE